MENIISPNFSDLLAQNIEIEHFPDADNYVRVPDVEKYAEKEVRVYHRLYPNQDSCLIQALLIGRIVKNAKKIELVAPYLPYSRQDKIWSKGEIKSAEIIAEMLKFAGYSRIITFDCHFLKKIGEFEYGGIMIKNLTLSNEIIEHAKKRFGNEFEIISPDAGANYMSQGKGMKKIRGDYGKGNIIYRDIEKIDINFDVNGKNILIIDDMVSTGTTMIKAIENLRKNGAGKIAIGATHGFFLKDSLKKLGQLSDYIFTSNTIPSSASQINFMDVLKNSL